MTATQCTEACRHGEDDLLVFEQSVKMKREGDLTLDSNLKETFADCVSLRSDGWIYSHIYHPATLQSQKNRTH